MAVVGGALLVGTAWARRERTSILHPVVLTIATVLPGLSAVWFLIGSSVWPIYFTSPVLVGASPVRTFADLVGTYLAEGLVLAVAAGVAGTWAVRSLPGHSERAD